MKLNKIWNERRHKLLIDMKKQNKSVDEIKNAFGSLLQYHPNKIYCGESYIISKFEKYIIKKTNESIINKFMPIQYTIDKKYSFFYNFKNDYILHFNVNHVDYVIILFYYIDNNIISYNIAFTTKKQYDDYLNKLEDFLENNEIYDITEDLYNELKTILEKETKLNNQDKILNAISYIIVDFYKNNLNKNTIFSIGQTKDYRKIDWYRFIIKNSFDNVTEMEKIDNNGDKIYYYKLENIKLKYD